MRNAKCKLVGLLLIFTLSGFVILTPVSAATQSWIGVGKYANYRGGVSLNLGSSLNASMLVDINWRMVSTTVNRVNVTGGWSMNIRVNAMGMNLTISYSTGGWEMMDLSNGNMVPPPGGDIFFGMEKGDAHTNLWIDNMTGLTQSNVSIGGRQCYEVPSSASIPVIPIPGGIPVTKYYDRATGVLMGLAISINLTSMGSLAPSSYEQLSSLSALSGNGRIGVNQLPGLSGFAMLTFPVVVNSTNVVPFAWNVGGDAVLWLESVGVLLGLSALFGVIIYTRKK